MRNRYPPRASSGFSLMELLVVISIIGATALFVMPAAARVFDRLQVGSARTVLVNKYNSARTAARVANRIAVLRLNGTRLLVERNAFTGTSKDTLGGVADLGAEYGVSISGPDSVRIDARGMLETKLSTAVKFVITRGTWSDSVRLSSYGRLTR